MDRHRGALRKEILTQGVKIDWIRRRFPAAIELRPHWMSETEWLEGEWVRDPERRWQWLGGRWALKTILQPWAEQWTGEIVPMARISIRSRDTRGSSVGPTAWLAGRPLPLFCSISHTVQAAAAAASLRCRPGIDLVETCRGLTASCGAPRRIGPAGDPPARWSLVEAAFKTGVCPSSFQPGRWQVSQISPGKYEIAAPNGKKVCGGFFALESRIAALCHWKTRNGKGAALEA